MKILLLFILLISPAHADELWSACASINEQMSAQDVSDNTGSISQAYDCENSVVTVVATIYPHISVEAVTAANESFIANYCLNVSKNYLLLDPTSQDWITSVYRGGVRYVVKHPDLPSPLVTEKTLDECLKYVRMMEEELPVNIYERTKYVLKFTP